MSEHTKTPWLKPCADEVGVVSKKDDQTYGMQVPILTCYSENAEADADFIVHCVNNHERLVEALRDVTENLEHARFMVPDGVVSSMLFDSTQAARALLAELDAGEGGE